MASIARWLMGKGAHADRLDLSDPDPAQRPGGGGIYFCTDHNVLEFINGTPAWDTLIRPGYPEGTSFPGSPATNDKFYRTDRNLLYFYDGTRWLTTTVYTHSIPIQAASFGANATAGRSVAAFGPTYDAWIVDLRAWLFVNGTNSGSAYWTVTLKDEVPNSIGSVNTSADAGSTNLYKIATIGALLGTARMQLLVDVGKTGSPAALFAAAMVTYRLVG